MINTPRAAQPQFGFSLRPKNSLSGGANGAKESGKRFLRDSAAILPLTTTGVVALDAVLQQNPVSTRELVVGAACAAFSVIFSKLVRR